MQRTVIRVFFIVTILCAGIMLGGVRRAVGDEFRLVPSFFLKQEYNDNILCTPTEVKRDFISTLAPGLSLIDRTERMDINLSGRIEQRIYSRYSDLNTTDQFYEGNMKYALTPRINLSGRTFYSSDSYPTRDIVTTGLPLAEVRRWRQNYTVSGDYVLSEKSQAAFSYDYLNDVYASNLYTNLETHGMNLLYTRDLSDIAVSTKGRINVGYSRYYMAGTKVDNYEATAGIARDLNEKWSLLIDAGGRYTETGFEAAQQIGTAFNPFKPPFFFPVYANVGQSNSGWGAVGRMSLTYTGERDTGSLNIAHDVFPASGFSGAVERLSIILSATRRFTWELYGTLMAGYYTNKSDQGQFGGQKINQDTMIVSPGIRYEWNRDVSTFSVEASYAYMKTKDNTYNTDTERNVFLLRFNMQTYLFN